MVFGFAFILVSVAPGQVMAIIRIAAL